MARSNLTCKDAGVSIDANADFVGRIQSLMHSTYGPRVCSRDGAFAGMFRLDYDEQLFKKNYRRPVLVGCTDGVGTKVLLAAQFDRLDTIGIDLVAMSVNDLITCGAEPLFFLDYLAVHKLDPPTLTRIVGGIAEGCRQAGCALLGGETAEMPDLYRQGEFDLAGFAVGVVEFHRSMVRRKVEPGDVLIGLPSSGVHSNGYTLVRKLVERSGLDPTEHVAELGEPLADAVLRPTRIYVRPILKLLGGYRVKRVVTGLAHVTGGGLPENVARALPPDCDAVIDTRRWTPPPIFAMLERLGAAHGEMFRVFNMGIGFVCIVRPDFASGAVRRLEQAGESPALIGRIKRGSGKVVLK